MEGKKWKSYDEVENGLKKEWEEFKKKWLDDNYLLKVDNFDKAETYFEALPKDVAELTTGKMGNIHIGRYFSKKTDLKKPDASKTPIGEIKQKIEKINLCIKNQCSDLDQEDFSAWPFLLKLIVNINYSKAADGKGKFDYFFWYTKTEIEKLYKKYIGGEETDFVKQNNEILKKMKGIFFPEKETLELKDALILSQMLSIIARSPDIEEISEESPNVIFYGPPGTGKTYAVKNIIDFVCQGDSSRYVWTQFHPNFSYEDFIDGIKPVGIEGNGNVKLELVNGVFKDLCIRAKNDPNNEYYFIADEINRANLSAVFGETLSKLEADYRDKLDGTQDNLIKTQYSSIETKLVGRSITKKVEGKDVKYVDATGEEVVYAYDEKNGARFGIPKNVRFIGMMNDVDKSIDAFDLALRRRFKWIRKECDSSVIEKLLEDCLFDAGRYAKDCERLNKFISSSSKNGLGLGESYQFGHSFFLHIREFVKKEQTEDYMKSCKKKLFNKYLSPTLKEYLRSFKEEKDIEGGKGYLNQAMNIFIGNDNVM